MMAFLCNIVTNYGTNSPKKSEEKDGRWILNMFKIQLPTKIQKNDSTRAAGSGANATNVGVTLVQTWYQHQKNAKNHVGKGGKVVVQSLWEGLKKC